ncbi:MAG: hypothetical protein WHX93_14940 [bacterium]
MGSIVIILVFVIFVRVIAVEAEESPIPPVTVFFAVTIAALRAVVINRPVTILVIAFSHVALLSFPCG